MGYVYDVSTRSTLKRGRDITSFPTEPFLFPDQHLGRVYLIDGTIHLVDVSEILNSLPYLCGIFEIPWLWDFKVKIRGYGSRTANF